jgi:hypothetical protein
MDKNRLRNLLRAVEEGDVSSGEALKHLENTSFDDIGFAKLDLHREMRCGLPEAIFCPGKTIAQIRAIARRLRGRDMNLLATRASEEVHRAIAALAPDAVWHEAARAVTVKRQKHAAPRGDILIVCAGTADIPVAEEARVTAEFLDNRVRAVQDVGVAGLHRLLGYRHELRRANVIIVVAGMEGALASVVGGMVARPVIAVPTSVGYGASFGGIAPLLTMLNSCAAGVAVVNIDNGFGAACVASLINHGD